MSFADEFGWTEVEFGAIRAEVRANIDALFANGGYPAIDMEYHALSAVSESELPAEQVYYKRVLANILVMA